ncbi:MAG: sodium/solute symporter [Planctomycetales bacterium]|nr:sodium/solute symporter [Planctomycetales bacterium]
MIDRTTNAPHKNRCSFPQLTARWATVILFTVNLAPAHGEEASRADKPWLEFEAFPNLPDPIGVAGPFVGVHNDALLVAGGANFPTAEGEDLWKASKVWHDRIWVLTRSGQGKLQWRDGGQLDRPRGYGACVSTSHGVACLGGNDESETFRDAFLLTWETAANKIEQTPLPSLPCAMAYGAATLLGDTIYLAGGQSDADLETAMANFWRLDLSPLARGEKLSQWEILPAWPGPVRAFNIVAVQHNGFEPCVYVIGGRNQLEGVAGLDGLAPLADVFEFNPRAFDAKQYDAESGEYHGSGEFAQPWRRMADAPRPIMAGGGAAVGQSHILVFSGADGSLFKQADALRDQHPGFPKNAWAFHTITNTWVDAGAMPANQVTTPVVPWGDEFIVASGEVRPRVRTNAVWRIRPAQRDRSFGAIDYAVLAVYLASMVGVGVYFSSKNKNTDDYFRGGSQVVWWAAGCSIFATMLSSITFMAIPAKAYAQNLVYLVGNMMIVAVAPIAVYLALPFYRRVDAASAYEYLGKRFNHSVRLFASGSFSVFHLFRMGIVMSLAGLALATVTPLTPSQCVLLMGVLSILYCTMGGVEAVIWTDTLQTVVLLGGALVCLFLMIAGTEGGLAGAYQMAADHGKLNLWNLHWDATSANLAIWVVVLGGIGQNISSYTGDQAVVQRYMTTPDERRAAGSIWFAAILAVPASLIFFGMGTALFAFYKSNPQHLDPTYTTDQILPLFIAQELPVGIAGLIVAGIFAAAQSTISTSMNSMATAVVTDFLRPARQGEPASTNFLRIARVLTFAFGVAGTALGLLFVSPDIKSLFDQFIKVVGLFMGVLGGLFALGALTRRASGAGALIGVVGGAAIMFALPYFTAINGYLYAAIGVSTCFLLGYLASLALPARGRDLTGLTIHDVPQ